jgi:hypothetical protein
LLEDVVQHFDPVLDQSKSQQHGRVGHLGGVETGE